VSDSELTDASVIMDEAVAGVAHSGV